MVLAHQVPAAFGEPFIVAAALFTWVILTLTYRRGWHRDRGRWRPIAFSAGTGLAIAVVLPPLEHLAEDLVSAHMVQHVTLILICAPLIALARPVETLLRGIPTRGRKIIGRWRRTARLTPTTTGRMTRPLVVWLVYALTIWFWHGAAAYELATESLWVHILEHAVFLGAALAFWSAVLVPSRKSASGGFRILMVFTTAFHSVLLGALLTFSDTPWYQSYAESTVALGLDPLSDQRLAGLLMWIPGGLVYTGAGLSILGSMLSEDHADDRMVGSSSR